ncbi:MAG TPA: hypothetical protein VL333_13055 [Candidatus Saccharimonadales bacterium]|jgi:hypothetical protein|nr:hypothetical protein [Candidatus Saccharimonadales bacterium]
MTAERLAYAMASRVLRERQRLARRLRVLLDDSGENLVSDLELLVAELFRSPSPTAPVERASPPPESAAPLFVATDDGLPEVHHMDDMVEGMALVQGGMHRRGLTGRLHR